MIPLPIASKIVGKEKNKAVFEIEGLYPGYGYTIGNSLRRVLISSLEGAAVTHMKIKNVSHEFSTIPGVMEDVVTVMLNLKQLRFKMFNPEPQKAILKIKGEKEVKGANFEIPSQLELMNPDCHIATLTQKSAELEIEIQVEKGIGFRSRDLKKKGEVVGHEIGTIALDAIFAPIRRVALRVENMRVGERTDFDRLSLEVETDGTITPEEAFEQASNILSDHFVMLKESFKKEFVPEKEAVKGEKETVKKEKPVLLRAKKKLLKQKNAKEKKGKKA